MRRLVHSVLLLLATVSAFAASSDEHFVLNEPSATTLMLAAPQQTAPLQVSRDDWPGVIRAAGDLAADVERVTGTRPALWQSATSRAPVMVMIGTLGRSPLVDKLVEQRKLDVSGVAGRWESFVLQTVANPLPGVDRALVIAGSDKRGTIYGIYELSQQIGVSPWYWWADATPEHRDALYIQEGRYAQHEPSVKYRGIFLNDEKPDLDYWVRATYGERPDPVNPGATVANFNSDFYARLFEVILRMKGNYLWPAMWNNAFAEDDADNARLADEYGIVMGTSHQEPMMRAQKEWDWHLQPKYGNWNFAKHPKVLTKFWREGVRARSDFENLYTLGLRGENDSEMVHTQAESIRLLQRIVDVQRNILRNEVDPDIRRVPQVWTLYKEVQGYYEHGLRVADDVTLLWAEDNWGNIRRLPTADEQQRAGGAGVYYHFDYHGGPRSYQWINTSPLARIQEQMSFAKSYGANRIWIVNVGHFKGYELPTEYFLDMAWDTARWTPDNVDDYTREWAAREFGDEHAAGIAEVLAKYTKFNGRRKPELLTPSTYSLVQDREWQRIVDDYDAVVAQAEAIYEQLPAHKRDAYYQLVLFPAKASSIVNAMYYAAARNALYAAQGRAATNRMAALTRELYATDGELMRYFNEDFAGGKWQHFMDQSHIGYTSWRDPPENSLDAIPLKELKLPVAASLGVAVEGDTRAWPGVDTPATLPEIDTFLRQQPYIDVFNRGSTPFAFTAKSNVAWLTLSATQGEVDEQTCIAVAIDWNKAPAGQADAVVTIAGAGRDVPVAVHVTIPTDISRETLDGFVESRGRVAIEAEHFRANRRGSAGRWTRIEDYGRTLSGMRADGTPYAPAARPGVDAPVLEYRAYLFTPGATTATLILAPTLNFMPDRGLRVAVSFDDRSPQTLQIVPQGYNAGNGNADWEKVVTDNARYVALTDELDTPGYHTLKVWMVDPAVVIQRVVITTPAAATQTTYLGPPESYRH